MMKNYRVVWEIDIEAETALGAASIARVIQLDKESTATVFTVTESNGKSEEIDLLAATRDATREVIDAATRYARST